MGKYDKYIISIFINGRGIIKEKIARLDNYPNIKQYIELRYSDSFSIEETLKRIQHNIEEKPKCPCCGKPLKYIGKKNKMFQKYCSNSCRSKLVNKYIWIEGQKKYNLNHYGVEYNTQTIEFKQKRKETLLKKYGNENYNNIEQRKQTNLCIYGSENYCNYDKRKETMIELYGTPNFNNVLKRCETIKNKDKQEYSNEENIVYNYLLLKFPDIIRQYTDKRYPFNCDFYVPSLDLFIEYHGSHFHNTHPFDNTNENDILELQKLHELANNSQQHKEGKKSQYDMMIYTWTDLDVRKLQTLKNNKLNYRIFYNINEVYEFIK